jgi:acetyl-CoA acetyltransferase
VRFEGIAVAGVGQIRFDMYNDVPQVELARDAGLLAMHDAGVNLADIDEVFVGYLGLQHQVGVKAVKEFGLTGLPVTHIENASATGLFAFREAAWAVSSGRAEIAMALCFDKMTEMTAARVSSGNKSRGAGRDQLDASILPAAFFALWAQRRMHEHGTKPETFAKIAAKNWNHGALNPLSHRQPDHIVTAEEVLASRKIAEPLTAMMSCPADDGAAAVIIASEEWVRAHQPDRRIVRPLSSAAQSEAYSQTTAQEAYDKAGVGPADVSLAMCHDAFANEELEYYELLGFCEPGEGDKLVDAEETSLGGRIPFNTDGGLIARGHPGGPTGAAMVHEIVVQLRREAGARRQVDNARIGLAHCVGGGSVCTVNLFEGVD